MRRIPLILVFLGLFTNLFSQSLDEILREVYKKDFYQKPSESAILRGSDDIKLSDDFDALTTEAETMIAINPNDSNNIVASYIGIGVGLDMPIYYTRDGGDTWLRSNFNSTDVARLDEKNTVLNEEGGGDPVMAFDGNGRLYYAWLSLNNNSSTGELRLSTYYVYSDDGGASFQTASDQKFIAVAGNFDGQSADPHPLEGVFDRPWLSCDMSGGQYDGRLYMAGIYYPDDSLSVRPGMSVFIKEPNQLSFTKVFAIDTGNVQFANLDVDENGVIHILYGDNNVDAIIYKQSSDGGVTWSQRQVLGIGNFSIFDEPIVNFRENPAPSISSETDSEYLHAVWTDFTDDVPRGLYAHSADNGVTWTQPLDLNSLLTVDALKIYFPSVSTNKNGKISINALALNDQNEALYVMIESKDHGKSFEPYVILSSESSDFKAAEFAFMGDYNESVRTHCKTFGIYSDYRFNQGPKTYVGIYNHCELDVATIERTPLDEGIILSQVYPSPAKSEVGFKVRALRPFHLTVNVKDMTGRSILQKEFGERSSGEHTFIMPLGSMISGTYLLEYWFGDRYFTRQLVVAK